MDEARSQDGGREIADMIRGRIRAGQKPRKKHSEMTAEELHKAATTSFVTGLKNKAAWDEDVQPEDHARVMIDADSLKYYNDVWGHAVGDELLRTIADAARAVGVADRFYHLSGDEFAYHNDPKKVDKDLQAVQEYLQDNPLEVNNAYGKGETLWVVPEVTYGTSEKSLPEADKALNAVKERREAEGLRAGRGEKPALVFDQPPSRREIENQRERVRHQRGLGERLTPEELQSLPMRQLFAWAERVGVADEIIDRGDRTEIISAIEAATPAYLKSLGLSEQQAPSPASESAPDAASQPDALKGDTTDDFAPQRGTPPADLADIDPQNTPLAEIPVESLEQMDLSALRQVGKRMNVPGFAKKDITRDDLAGRVQGALQKYQARHKVEPAPAAPEARAWPM